MDLDGVPPRVVGEEDLAGFTAGRLLEVTAAVTMILTLPAVYPIDALAVATGQGEQWRLVHAIREWDADPRLRHLLVANGNPAERTYVDITLDHLHDLGLRRVGGVCIQAEPAPNTSLQALWIAEQIRERGITGLGLVVSPYHLPRAYLTVLKELGRAGIRLPLIPVPVDVAPGTPVPETGATAYDLVPGEVKRILTYMDKGWVATLEELQVYLEWLWGWLPTTAAGDERG